MTWVSGTSQGEEEEAKKARRPMVCSVDATHTEK
jgi:hypothetical protein